MREHNESTGSGFSRRDMLRFGLAGGLAVTAGGLLVGCSGDGAPSTGAGSVGPPQKGGTLTVGMISAGDTEAVDPWAYLETTGYVRAINLYDTLFEFDDELMLQPALAESAEASADKMTWTFRLRDGVTFHDGSALTADDLITNAQVWADPNSWPAQNGGSAIDPKQITKIDDRTVRIGLKAPDARFDRTLAFLSFSVKSRNEKKVGNPIGTGPFKFVSFDPGSRSEFERFEDHWRPEPVYLDRLVVDTSFTDENARTNALRSGQVDLAPLVSFGLAKAIPTQTARLLRAPSGAFNNLLMAVDTAPFDDANVRQAMRLLVDRQAMVDVTFAGYGAVSNDVPGLYTPYYDDSLVRERDVDQARFLLKKAGKEGLTVTLDSPVVADSVTQAATLFKQQAQEAGVTVNIKQVDAATWGARYGTFTFSQTLYYPVPSMEFVWRNSFVSEGYVNDTHWFNSPFFERTKSLFEEQQRTDDESKLTEIWGELQKQQFDEGGYINYGTYEYVDAMANRVEGLTPSRYLFASGCNLRRAWVTS
jgi:peptide/nickel transport system substrate-binding protein